jgi:hypothetical protein
MLIGFVTSISKDSSEQLAVARSFSLADQVEMGRTLMLLFLLVGAHDSKPALLSQGLYEILRKDCLSRWLRQVRDGKKMLFEVIPKYECEWRLTNVRSLIGY